MFKPSKLKELPTEIRLMIFGYLLQSAKSLTEIPEYLKWRVKEAEPSPTDEDRQPPNSIDPSNQLELFNCHQRSSEHVINSIPRVLICHTQTRL